LERSHHSLKEYIKTIIPNQDEWPEVLELATFSYNCSVHESHQFTPYELVFGKTARLPSKEVLGEEDQLPTYEDYVTNLSKRLNRIQRIAREKINRF